MLLLSGITLLASCDRAPVAADKISNVVDEPKNGTQIEAFQAKTGVVIVRGYSAAGSMEANNSSSIRIEAREFRDASMPNKRVSGIAVEIEQSNRNSTTSRVYVDSDEIDGLLAGIDYVAKMDNAATTMENFEAEFRTRGGLSLTVFNISGGRRLSELSIDRAGGARVYLDLEKLPELRQLIAGAKAKL